MKEKKSQSRKRRHRRIRTKVFGTPERMRLSVYRSLNHVYAQIIDDSKGHTLASASSLDKELADRKTHGGNMQTAQKVGALIAKRALEKGIKHIVFDRSGYMYHGSIRALAEAVREAGLDF